MIPGNSSGLSTIPALPSWESKEAWARACCRPVADWLPPARSHVPRFSGLLLALYSGLSDCTESIPTNIAGFEGVGAAGVFDRGSILRRGFGLFFNPCEMRAEPCRWQDENAASAGRKRDRRMDDPGPLGAAPAAADGGSLRFTAKEGGYQVTVFSAPTPLPPVLSDIQRAGSGQIDGVADAQMAGDLCIAKLGQPALEYPATREAATQQALPARPSLCFLAAPLENAGRGRGFAHGTVVIEGDLDAAGPLPRWALKPGRGLAGPRLAIALFGIHRECWGPTSEPRATTVLALPKREDQQ